MIFVAYHETLKFKTFVLPFILKSDRIVENKKALIQCLALTNLDNFHKFNLKNLFPLIDRYKWDFGLNMVDGGGPPPLG